MFIFLVEYNIFHHRIEGRAKYMIFSPSSFPSPWAFPPWIRLIASFPFPMFPFMSPPTIHLSLPSTFSNSSCKTNQNCSLSSSKLHVCGAYTLKMFTGKSSNESRTHNMRLFFLFTSLTKSFKSLARIIPIPFLFSLLTPPYMSVIHHLVRWTYFLFISFPARITHTLLFPS